MTAFRFVLLMWVLVVMVRVGCAETIGEVTNPKRANNTWVSDMAHVLTADTERRINSTISQLERKNGAEMAVVTIRRTDGSHAKEFATRLFNIWGIGKRGRDNGVLVLLVMEARRIEVETGTGLSQTLPDEKAQRILRERVIPRFKEDDYNGGVWAGAQALAQALESPTPVKTVPQATLRDKADKASSPDKAASPGTRSLQDGETPVTVGGSGAGRDFEPTPGGLLLLRLLLFRPGLEWRRGSRRAVVHREVHREVRRVVCCRWLPGCCWCRWAGGLFIARRCGIARSASSRCAGCLKARTMRCWSFTSRLKSSWGAWIIASGAAIRATPGLPSAW